MSTKLNADAIALERFKEDEEAYDMTAFEGYAAAIREVAQPIADERDDLREALELIANTDPDEGTAWFHRVADAILAKYPKP